MTKAHLLRLGAILVTLVPLLGLGAPARAAREFVWGGKLLLTSGVTNIEGASGGGLATWAVIAGNETDDGIGGKAHFTYAGVDDYELRSFGAALGFYNRIEISVARQYFDTGKTGEALGLGRGFTFRQDIVGMKFRLLGDAIYDQDKLLPQIAAGVQYKNNSKNAVVRAVGARKDEGIDFYVAATKLILSQSLLVDATVRLTKANQTGLLGFGGDGDNAYRPQFEGSLAYMLSRRLVIGGEYRSKPDNLGFAGENDWWDAFVAYGVNHHLTLTAAYVDLGSIATFDGQTGLFLSLQGSF